MPLYRYLNSTYMKATAASHCTKVINPFRENTSGLRTKTEVNTSSLILFSYIFCPSSWSERNKKAKGTNKSFFFFFFVYINYLKIHLSTRYQNKTRGTEMTSKEISKLRALRVSCFTYISIMRVLPTIIPNYVLLVTSY